MCSRVYKYIFIWKRLNDKLTCKLGIKRENTLELFGNEKRETFLREKGQNKY